MSARATALCLLAGCSYVTDSFETNDFSGDPFPIDIDTTSGAIIVGARTGADAIRTTVLDVLSPITLFDEGAAVKASITYPDVTILGERGPGGTLDLPRAKLVGAQVVAFHPCDAATCDVGLSASPRPFDALVGVSAFVSDALRLDLATSQMYILPNVAGTTGNRSRACDAVLPAPFRGGGTMLLGGTELGFTNWRIAIDTCLSPRPAQNDPATGTFVPQAARGADVLLVLSTGIGISLLGESAYARYRQVVTTAPDLATLPGDTALLPSGPISGKRATIQPQQAGLPSLALVAMSNADPRAPCRQVWASHLLVERDCAPDGSDDCPCAAGSFTCGVPAVVELTPALDVLVVSDAEPTLQALRAELRPDQPEVDGILGADALRALELDIDYPHDRLLGRCHDASVCTARPQLTSSDCGKGLISIDPDCIDRTHVQGCLGELP